MASSPRRRLKGERRAHGALRVATLNVRGLAARRRQQQLYRLFSEHELDIVAIQETKVESEGRTDCMLRSFVTRYDVCVSHAVGLSAGCCLFIKKSIGAVVQTVATCPSGRFVM